MNHWLVAPRICYQSHFIMAFEFVFLDESGHFTDSDYICLAGFMATNDDWNALCIAWRFLLREKWNLPAIHMKEIMSPLGKSPAASWDIERKVEMLRDFILIIRKYTSVGFGCAIDAKHYRKVVKDVEIIAHSQGLKTRPFKAQVFCMVRVVRRIMDYLDEIKASEDDRKISLIFDDDEQHSRQCYSMFCELKKRRPKIKGTIVGICFADDVYCYPLQAADILSYAACNELKKGKDAWKDSNVFTNLLKGEDPTYAKIYRSEKYTDDEEDTKKLMDVIILESVQFHGNKIMEDKDSL